MKTKALKLNKALQIILFAFFAVSSLFVFSQGIAINSTGTAANPDAILDVNSTTKGILIPRMTEVQRNAISALTAGLLIYQTDAIPGFYYYNGSTWVLIISSATNLHYVGELYGGGVVFYVDSTGNHGLIAGMVDLSTCHAWSNITSTAIGTTNFYDGVGNTNKIISQNGHIFSAAQICDNYTNANYNTGIFSDWYLPAVTEIEMMFHNRAYINYAIEKGGVGGTELPFSGYYWSSSEFNADYAWHWYVTVGNMGSGGKNNTFYVRAIRAF